MTEHLNKPTYVFGYGSLCYPDGINGRGMWKKYDWNDLQVVDLIDYERGMSAFGIGLPWYGVVPRCGSVVNGVLLKIESPHDLQVLSWSEHIGEVYTLDDVTKNIVGADIEPDAVVFTCVAIPTGEPYTGGNMRYLVNVYRGIQYWGTKFVNKFKENTVDVDFNEVERRVKE